MSGASLFGSWLALVITAGLWVAIGVCIVAVETYANTMSLPQDSYNVITIFNAAYVAIGVIMLVLIALNHWLNSKSEANMGV